MKFPLLPMGRICLDLFRFESSLRETFVSQTKISCRKLFEWSKEGSSNNQNKETLFPKKKLPNQKERMCYNYLEN